MERADLGREADENALHRGHADSRVEEGHRSAALPCPTATYPACKGCQESIVWLLELAQALVEELLRAPLEIDSNLVKPVEQFFTGRQPVDQARRRLSVVRVRTQCLRWERGNGLRADQCVHVLRIGIARVLRTRTGPEELLWAPAVGAKPRESTGRSLEALLEDRVRAPRTRDRDQAAKRSRRLGEHAPVVCNALKPPVEKRVNPAHKEARDGSNATQRLPAARSVFETIQVDTNDLAVTPEIEQEGDVDVDSVGNELSNRREPPRGSPAP